MADKKISELDLALRINNDAVFPMSQDNAGEPTTFKVGITQLGIEIAEGLTFSNLQTTSKELVGAINELLSLGSPIIIGTTAPTASQGANGNLYIQYTAGTGGAEDEVDGIYIKINGAWCEIQTGGGGAGGHTIVDNAGTDLAQRTNLQFLGAYSEDNSTDDTTEVNVVRSMTKAEFNQLSADEKVGFINITDEEGQITADNLPISSSDPTNTKDYIDTGLSGKANIISEVPTTTNMTVSCASGWGVAMLTITRSYDSLSGIYYLLCGVNTANAKIVDIFNGSSITKAVASGTSFTFSSSSLDTCQVRLIPLVSDWSLSYS